MNTTHTSDDFVAEIVVEQHLGRLNEGTIVNICAAKRYTTHIVMLVAFSAVLLSSEAWAKQPFPFERGTYWVYAGYIMSGTPDAIVYTNLGNGIRVQSLDSFHRRGIHVALLDGFPTALDWKHAPYWDNGIKPDRRNFLVIRKKNGEYVVTSKDADALYAKLSSSDDLRTDIDLLQETEDIWINDRSPALGAKSGDEEAVKREDDRYCWVVNRISKEKLLEVSSINPKEKYDVFSFSFYSSPDHTELDFAPALGIIKYEYIHHGSILEEHVYLREWGKK
jgi:hypothetical protein